MVGVLLAFLLSFVLVTAMRAVSPSGENPRLYGIVFGGYLLRLLASGFVPDLNLFSYGKGGDSLTYEAWGVAIARLWQFAGVHYVTADEMPEIQQVSLPSNMFGLIDYLNGEPTHFGCTALVAAVGCLTCINVYSMALEIGARKSVATAIAAAVLFSPSYVLFTADTYKDGLVAFFEFGILGSALRLARRFSVVHVGIAVLCFAGLWLTRFYLVYVMVVPIILGTLGIRSRSLGRMALTGLILVGVGMAALAYTNGLQTVSEHATQTFQGGTSEAVRAGNSMGGSSVSLGSTSPFGALPLKILYTLFAPFPWQSGSLGLQIAKFEMIGWYYILYRAIRAIPILWQLRKSDLIILLTFIVPSTFVYTVSFVNVGLVMRERMGVVIAVSLLASVSWRGFLAVANGGEVVSLQAVGRHTAQGSRL